MAVLDYGCGRGDDVDALKKMGIKIEGYDPYWKPDIRSLKKKYDVVMCNYVLNVVDKRERIAIIDKVKSLLKKNGRAYFSVRRDINKDYSTKSGTQQYVVKLDSDILFEKKSAYCIYEI